MKYRLFSLLIIGGISSVNASVSGDFSVSSVGASNNTNSVFIETLETVGGTNCSNNKTFKISKDDSLADKFYSLAIAAQAQNKKITINYETNECFDDGTLIKVFRLKL